MRHLLDSHILLALLKQETRSLPLRVRDLLHAEDADHHASVASIWEIAIKSRLGKLELPWQLDMLPVLAADAGIGILPVSVEHALHDLDPLPPTSDPFDRLLLAQCAVEGMRLITIDRSLAGHPYAVRS